jgi:hypothetical protein
LNSIHTTANTNVPRRSLSSGAPKRIKLVMMILQQLMIHHGEAGNLESGVTRQFILITSAPTSGSSSSGRFSYGNKSSPNFYKKIFFFFLFFFLLLLLVFPKLFSCRLLAGQPTQEDLAG